MNALWSYFWPVFGLSLLVGGIAGIFAWRPGARRWTLLAAGAVPMLGAALLWHGPLGGADRLARPVDRIAREALIHYEMPQVQARLQRGPVTRKMLLSGPADDFQRREIVRMMSEIPGVSAASWSRGGGLPLIVEGAVVGLVGYLLGCLLAYAASLHRRNSQERW
ncbi:MAG: hypothetical protein M3428_02070 [Pseudomonadota bacterium]|jgi:hypothetical protein|nr:hypothetical protein [Sphingomonas sp.]MDQ3471160.1 hypothetical protein [Pseudomonadota bacterium]